MGGVDGRGESGSDAVAAGGGCGGGVVAGEGDRRGGGDYEAVGGGEGVACGDGGGEWAGAGFVVFDESWELRCLIWFALVREGAQKGACLR